MNLDAHGRSAFVEGNYRYWLARNWGSASNRVTFIGLNPSTADAMQDDPTIRKCIGFAKRFRFGSLLMLNLFAYRATNPRALTADIDPFGNRDHFWSGFEQVKRGEIVVCAWGASVPEHFYPIDMPRQALECLHQQGARLQALQLNKNGSPKHPLYTAYSRQLVHYRGVLEGAMR